jgi:UDP-N-acetylmuramoyl-tripeptide--D-alanyl-D-alanine ligase
MLELGPDAARLHVEVAEDIEANGVDLVFCAGPLMKGLFDALPGERKGAWAPAASEIESALLGAIRPGDAVMVKGSNGSRMGPIVAAIRKHAAGSPADEVSEC